MRSSIIAATLAACSLFSHSMGHPRMPSGMGRGSLPIAIDPLVDAITPEILEHLKESHDPRINMLDTKMLTLPRILGPAMPQPKLLDSPGDSAHGTAYCGTREPGPDLLRQRLRVRDELPRPPKGPILIDTYLHLVYSEKNSVTDSDNWYKDQLEVLNRTYGPYDISFNFVNKSYTRNELWSKGFYENNLEMGKELRRGDYASLNIYFLSGLHDGNPNKLYGEGEFPYVQHVERSDGFLTDGVRLDFNTMPGGHPIDNNTFYGHGISATHEIGHWMGLMHPWTHPERGDPCHADDTNEGDQIVDTPPQTLEWRHCYKSIEKYDSCPGQDGFDSIHNYMSYTEDQCKTEFTPGQVDYMRSHWTYYRDKKGIQQRQRLLRF